MTKRFDATALHDARKLLRSRMAATADPDKAEQMAAYMRGQFPFLGVTAPARKAAGKPLLLAGKAAPSQIILETTRALFAEPEREFHQLAVDFVRRYHQVLVGSDLPALASLIRTHSWWDTVDSLAANVVGPVVGRDRSLDQVMDGWAESDNMWIARSAILHQLNFKEATDEGRLFRYVLMHKRSTEFFIRKALGWALRQHATLAPRAVVTFVRQHEGQLSPLTVREALKRQK